MQQQLQTTSGWSVGFVESIAVNVNGSLTCWQFALADDKTSRIYFLHTRTRACIEVLTLEPNQQFIPKRFPDSCNCAHVLVCLRIEARHSPKHPEKCFAISCLQNVVECVLEVDRRASQMER